MGLNKLKTFLLVIFELYGIGFSVLFILLSTFSELDIGVIFYKSIVWPATIILEDAALYFLNIFIVSYGVYFIVRIPESSKSRLKILRKAIRLLLELYFVGYFAFIGLYITFLILGGKSIETVFYTLVYFFPWIYRINNFEENMYWFHQVWLILTFPISIGVFTRNNGKKKDTSNISQQYKEKIRPGFLEEKAVTSKWHNQLKDLVIFLFVMLHLIFPVYHTDFISGTSAGGLAFFIIIGIHGGGSLLVVGFLRKEPALPRYHLNVESIRKRQKLILSKFNYRQYRRLRYAFRNYGFLIAVMDILFAWLIHLVLLVGWNIDLLVGLWLTVLFFGFIVLLSQIALFVISLIKGSDLSELSSQGGLNECRASSRETTG